MSAIITGPDPRPSWRIYICAALALLILAGAAAAQEPGLPPLGPALTEDPVLNSLVREALAGRPELGQAQALISAATERVPQARTLPDPMVSTAIQNDGFQKIMIGTMPTSFYSVMASQTFPLPEKLDLRAEVETLGVHEAEADLRRAQLSVQAQVERAYVDLLLTRDQLMLQAKLETIWEQVEGLAAAQYESGMGPQSDLLRAQLQRNRLKQQRWTLEAEEHRRTQVLNRLRGHSLEDAISTTRTLADMPDPAVPDSGDAIKDAQALSPELLKAQLMQEQSRKQKELAKLGYVPDLTLSAGAMPRGDLDPMWQAGVSFTVPVWAKDKQAKAVAESGARLNAAAHGLTAVEQVLDQRVAERVTLLGALVKQNDLYRSGLLEQSQATVQSTTAQYQTGKVPLASVLEALAAYLSDYNGFLESVAAAQKIDIAQREVSLDAVTGSKPAMSASSPGGSPQSGM